MAEDVQVKFGAQIDGLVAGINDAKESLESITAPISGITDAFQGLGEAAVAGLAIDKVYDYQKELASLGEEIERTASLTGLSTDEVQQFQFAVKMTGGDAETAASSLLLLERNIAEAQSGSGRAYQAFVNLGVSLNDLKSKSPNEILQQMAERFSETGDNAQQAAIKIDYMRTVAGRAGTNLIPLLNQGPEGLQKLNDVLDSTNAKLSPGMVEALAEAKRTSIEANEAWRGFYQTIGSTGFFDAVNKDMIDLAHAATEVASAVKAADKAFDDFISDQSDRIPTEAEKFTAAANELRAAMASHGGKAQPYGPPAPAPATGNPLPALPTGADAGKEDNTETQIAQDRIKTQEDLAKIGLATQKDMLEQEVDAQLITKAQEYAALQDYLGLEYQVESDALDKKLALYGQDSREYQEALNQKTLLDAQYGQQLQKLAAEQSAAQLAEIKKTQESYKGFFDTVDKDLDTMLQGVLQGTQTWQAAMARVFDNLALSFIEDIGKMLVKAAALQAVDLIGGGGGNLSKAIGGEVPQALGGSQSNSANPLTAAVTALTTYLGLNTAAQTAAYAATTLNTASTVTSTGQNAISTVENTTATVSNTAALGASGGGGFLGLLKGLLPSYDVGSWNVASDQMALIHQNEMIIPAGPANAIRSGSVSLGGASGGTSGAGNFNITIQAIDTQTGAQFLKQNASVIASTLSGQMRNFNSALKR